MVRDRRVLARRQEDDVVAGADAAGLDGADEDAPVVAGLRELVDVLQRHAERPVEVVVELLEVLDLLEHRRAVVPGGGRGARDDVVAVARADRDEAGGVHAEPAEEVGVLGDDRVELGLVPVQQVHLVDQHADLADAEHAEDVAVPLGVLPHALEGVDDEQRRLRARGAGDHVLEELHVARGVVDDVVALRRVEEAARRVDGDALRLLVLQGVQEERVLEGARVLLAHLLDLLQLAVGQGAGVGHEPADDGALAVVHVAHGDDVEALEVERRDLAGGGRRAALGLGRHGLIGRQAHMYPPRRSDSRPPPSSLSWARPLRSAMLLNLPVRSSG